MLYESDRDICDLNKSVFDDHTVSVQPESVQSVCEQSAQVWRMQNVLVFQPRSNQQI